jgi:hypothetical protein
MDLQAQPTVLPGQEDRDPPADLAEGVVDGVLHQHRIPLPDDPALLQGLAREPALVDGQRATDLVVSMDGLRRVRAHLGHDDQSIGPPLPTQEQQVGEGEIGQQLPFADQPGQVLRLRPAQVGALGDQVREGHRAEW